MTFVRMGGRMMYERKQSIIDFLITVTRARKIQRRIRDYFASVGGTCIDRTRLNGAQ
jgi:hypothetical protein